jgi:hypothetical protein
LVLDCNGRYIHHLQHIIPSVSCHSTVPCALRKAVRLIHPFAPARLHHLSHADFRDHSNLSSWQRPDCSGSPRLIGPSPPSGHLVSITSSNRSGRSDPVISSPGHVELILYCLITCSGVLFAQFCARTLSPPLLSLPLHCAHYVVPASSCNLDSFPIVYPSRIRHPRRRFFDSCLPMRQSVVRIRTVHFGRLFLSQNLNLVPPLLVSGTRQWAGSDPFFQS